ncbi:MAG TPA: TIGR01777 family oxidoreductase [Ohtaekwangia sp.]|uniref:TIGR01777 family oxidoreductase n=1 Tax=Ohtaekwangia sp. TaxID=2066019 RepID=UPI002F92C87C
MSLKNILITGASGLIGTRLTELLLAEGHRVTHLGRNHRSGSAKTFLWDVDKNQFDRHALEGTEVIVHLAGAGVADKPWTDERKWEILKSRTQSTQLLFNELQKGGHQVKTFVSASAIGYYGFENNEKVYSENDTPGNDFLANVVRQWEAEIDRIQELGIRVVKVRIGIVLSEKAGALKEMSKPIKYFAGSPLGSGEQYISWIHLDDIVSIFIKAIQDEKMTGAYNGSGPYPVTNRELTKAIAQTLHKPLFLPAVPAFALKMLLGEMANLVLKGSKVSSEKIQQAGFKFQFDTLEKALADLLTR